MRYYFNEPWDSSNNKTLLKECQYSYACPSDHAASPWDSTATSYVAVVERDAKGQGEKTAVRQGHDAEVRKADTFLIIETADSGIQCLEPKDVCFDDVQTLRSMLANSPHRQDRGYFFHDTPGVNAVLVAGDRIFVFSSDSTDGLLAALLHSNPPPATTNKAVHQDLFQAADKPVYNPFYREEPRLHWAHCIGLPTWLCAVGLLAYLVICSRMARQTSAGGKISGEHS